MRREDYNTVRLQASVGNLTPDQELRCLGSKNRAVRSARFTRARRQRIAYSCNLQLRGPVDAEPGASDNDSDMRESAHDSSDWGSDDVARLEVLSIPIYYVTMGAEYAHHRRRAANGITTDGDYELKDTLTSLSMGGLSLLIPLVSPRLTRPLTPGKGRYGRYLVGGTIAAVAATTIADAVVRRTSDDRANSKAGTVEPDARSISRRKWHRIAQKVARVGGVASIAGGVVAATTTWANVIRPDRMWAKRIVPDLGTGVMAWTTAIVGWDFLYYLNHRIWHSTRFMWANHVMHHSSERYNLSTALRQAVTDPLLLPVPYTGLSLLGVRPELVATSRSLNLLYQYWVHTDAIRTLGPFEEFANTPSHHRVHHGSDQRYIDRNHGGILIVFDRLLGTFTREDDTPTYGLTKNINSFNPLRVATHEYVDILRDVADSDNWTDRLSFTFRGPGWAYERHRQREAGGIARSAAAADPERVAVSAGQTAGTARPAA